MALSTHMPKRHRVLLSSAAAVIMTTGLAITTVPARASTPPGPPGGTAPGGPGAASYLDQARKDCFGTAHETRSKVWFTVADGVLPDVYSLTIDNTNLNTLQYVVTDGQTFTDLQTRDMTYTVTSPDRSGMVCRVTSIDAKHGFQLVTDYVTDPQRDSVVMRTTIHQLRGAAQSATDLKVYVRYDATIDNSGGGGPAKRWPQSA